MRAIVLAVLLGAGCATAGAAGASGASGTSGASGASGAASAGPSLTIEGESRGRNVALNVTGEMAGGHGRIKLMVVNLTDDAVGIDIDEIRLQNAGRTVKVLGRPQSFSEGGERTVRRVAHGATTVGPRERQALMLEFDDAPAPPGLVLFIPGVYKLGIEGQENQKPIKLPLFVSKASAAPTGEGENSYNSDDGNQGKGTAKDEKGKDEKAKDEKAKDGWFDPFVEW